MRVIEQRWHILLSIFSFMAIAFAIGSNQIESFLRMMHVGERETVLPSKLPQASPTVQPPKKAASSAPTVIQGPHETGAPNWNRSRVIPFVKHALTIDGSADDWDLNCGTYLCVDYTDSPETNGVWLHLAIDENNLYIYSRIRAMMEDTAPTPVPPSEEVPASSPVRKLRERLQVAFRTDMDVAVNLWPIID
ncbi:MAG: hypothetical protein D6820_18260, partial [Lentisphaerae bacterium]